MAYLNVRERKMETRVAYVGPLGVGKTKNLEQLGLRAKPSARAATRSTRDEGDVLTLAWDPDTTFRDFPIAVEVVAPCDATPEGTTSLVRDADAVVVVLDASPDAAGRNRAAVELVREALVSNDVPVVVQVNKTDMSDARAVDTIVAELGIVWPHVAAAASRGEGVVETLERALADLVARLASEEPAAEEGAPRATPLLDALKGVLEATVSKRARAIEDTFAERLEARFARAKADDAATLAALGKLVAEESAKTRAAIEGLRDRTDAMERLAHDLSARVTSGTDDTLRGLATHTTALAAHAGALSALEQKAGDPRVVEAGIEAIRNEQKRQRDEIATKLDRKGEEVRAELVRAMEARAKTDRELVISSVAAVKGALDGLGHDVRHGLSELTRSVVDVRAKLDALVPVAGAVKDLHRALRDEVGAAIVARVGKVEELVRAVGEANREGSQKSEERDTELGERVKEIGVAMKTKKSWFT